MWNMMSDDDVGNGDVNVEKLNDDSFEGRVRRSEDSTEDSVAGILVVDELCMHESLAEDEDRSSYEKWNICHEKCMKVESYMS